MKKREKHIEEGPTSRGLVFLSIKSKWGLRQSDSKRDFTLLYMFLLPTLEHMAPEGSELGWLVQRYSLSIKPVTNRGATEWINEWLGSSMENQLDVKRV